MGRFFDELKRRGVVRVGVAYLVVSWLLLQITDVLSSLSVLPEPFGRYLFFVLLLGLPLALILAWAYELTPEGVKLSKDVETPATTARFGGRKIDFVIIAALSLVIVVLVVDNYLPDSETGTESGVPPMVSGYTQLSKSQVILPPFPSPFPLVTDASRIYFNTFEFGRVPVHQLSRTGGEAVSIESPIDADEIVIPYAMTPDRSKLLIGVTSSGSHSDLSLWLWPVVGGDPRRLGAGADATYSPDGSQLLYTNGFDELHVARPDMSDSKKIVTVPGKIHWPSFSPDGKRIRFTLVTMPAREMLWEVSSDGSGLQQVFSDWDPTGQCCGSWTADGKYYVFSATVDHRSQIWATREQDGVRNKPVQITTGALEFRRPTIIDDGKKIFAIGWQLRGEVVRHDSDSGQFVPVPGLDALSAEWLAFSRDEEWVSYVSYPEGDLWRSKSDSSKRLQLTFPPMRVVGSAWSPDGQSIAFEGRMPEEKWKIYIVPAIGGSPRSVTTEDNYHWSPSWSPDGESLAFTTGGKDRIQILDSASGVVSEMDGSDGLDDPAWSRDGRYLAAHSRDRQRLMLFDASTEKWRQLIDADHISAQRWAADEQHLYFEGSFRPADRRAMYRVSIPDGEVEQIATVEDKRMVWGANQMWVGVSPDGSPMLLRDLSIHHIYALDWLLD